MSLFVKNLFSLLVAQQEKYSIFSPAQTRASLQKQIADTLEASRVYMEVWTLEGGVTGGVGAWKGLRPLRLGVGAELEPFPGEHVLQVYQLDRPQTWFALTLGPCVFPNVAAAEEYIKELELAQSRQDNHNDIVELVLNADRDDLDELLNVLQLSRVSATPALNPDERQELEALRRFRNSNAPWPEHATADIRADPNDQGWGRMVGGVLYPRMPTTPERDPLDRSVWRVARSIPEDFIRVNGEPCPVPPDTAVEYLHSGFNNRTPPKCGRAGDLRWYRTGSPEDIIAYRTAPQSEVTVNLTGTASQQDAQAIAKAYTDLKNDNL